MDEIHDNETSANSEIDTKKKLKIMISLSNLITEVWHDSASVLTSKNVVERLIAIIKMLTIKCGDMNNNEEVDTMDIANIHAKCGNMTLPIW